MTSGPGQPMEFAADMPRNPRDWPNPRDSWRRFLDERFDYRRPNYRIVFDYDRLAVEVQVKTKNTYSAVDVAPEDLNVSHHHRLPDFYQDDQWAARVMRDILHRVDNHETDEWIRVDGVMVFDPHRNDPR